MRFLFLFFLALLMSCQTSLNEERLDTTGVYPESEAVFYDEEGDQEFNESQINQRPQEKRTEKLIRTGALRFEVTTIEKRKEAVEELIGRLNGYIENIHFNSYGSRLEYQMKLRVPNENFDTLVTQLEKGSGKLVSKNIAVQDVSEEYVDLQIRLENNLSYLKQYQEILKRAKTIKDVLEVQEKIRRLEEEIESRKGRMSFLDNQVAYSTLDVTLSELVAERFEDRPRFLRRLGNAFQSGFASFINFIVGTVAIWPYLIIVIVLLFFRRRIINIFKRRKD